MVPTTNAGKKAANASLFFPLILSPRKHKRKALSFSLSGISAGHRSLPLSFPRGGSSARGEARRTGEGFCLSHLVGDVLLCDDELFLYLPLALLLAPAPLRLMPVAAAAGLFMMDDDSSVGKARMGEGGKPRERRKSSHRSLREEPKRRRLGRRLLDGKRRRRGGTQRRRVLFAPTATACA